MQLGNVKNLSKNIKKCLTGIFAYDIKYLSINDKYLTKGIDYMENAKIARIKKAAGFTAKVLNVGKYLLIAVIAVSFIAGIGAMIIKDEALAGSTVRMRIPFLFGNADDGSAFVTKWLNVKEPNVQAGLGALEVTVIAAFMLALIIVLRKTFLEIVKSDTPFREEILRRIRLTGILLTALVLRYSIANAVIVGLTAWCVYCIFDYGVELQKNEDETL